MILWSVAFLLLLLFLLTRVSNKNDNSARRFYINRASLCDATLAYRKACDSKTPRGCPCGCSNGLTRFARSLRTFQILVTREDSDLEVLQIKDRVGQLTVEVVVVNKENDEFGKIREVGWERPRQFVVGDFDEFKLV